MALRNEEFWSFTDQPVVLQERRKVRENGQFCQDTLHDLYNFCTKEIQRIFIIILGHVV